MFAQVHMTYFQSRIKRWGARGNFHWRAPMM